jgi:protease-4
MKGKDYLVERFQLKNKLNKWKFISALFLISLILVFTYFNKSENSSIPYVNKQYIASIEINGMIFQDNDVLNTLNNIKNNEAIKAVIVKINSPGGTAVGGESVYKSFRDISAKKPIVASIGETGASAAYMIALGTDKIFAYNTSIVGSVGVIMQNVVIGDLAKKLGVNFEIITSSEFKGAPNHVEMMNEKQKDYIDGLIKENYLFFVNIVKERRELKEEELQNVANGKVFLGAKAKELNLIDEIGDYEDALKWLKSHNKEVSTLKVQKVTLVKPVNKLNKFFDFCFNSVSYVYSLISNTVI